VSATGAGITVKVAKTASTATAVAVTTNQASYTRGQTVSITAKVTSRDSPISKAPVTFAIIKSNGAKVTANATTGSNGTAVYKLRIGKTDPLGSYQADASTTANGVLGAGAATFIVQ
jgi:hypothetical protein